MEFEITYYELPSTPGANEKWPISLRAIDVLETKDPQTTLGFYHFQAIVIKWLEENSLTSKSTTFEIGFWQDLEDIGPLDTLVTWLPHGQIASDWGDGNAFVSIMDNDQLLEQVSALLNISTKNWTINSHLKREESLLSDMLAYLIKCKLRGHSIVGIGLE